MKIKRSTLERIVREEMGKHLASLLEAPDLEDSQEDNKNKEDEKDAPDAGKNGNMLDTRTGETSKSKDDKELAAVEDPADDALADAPDDLKDRQAAKDAEPEDAKEKQPDDLKDTEKDIEDADEITGGEIAEKITGQTIQSISLNPKSKIMPGSQELELQFTALPEPLKILVNKSGDISFYFRGGLHKTL